MNTNETQVQTPETTLLRDNPAWDANGREAIWHSTDLLWAQIEQLDTILDHDGRLLPAAEAVIEEHAEQHGCDGNPIGMDSARATYARTAEFIQKYLAE